MREIKVWVTGQFIRKSSKHGGVQGEGNVTKMSISFDDSWTGYGKRIVWRDAKGEGPVAVILGDGQRSGAGLLDYEVLIPPEPLAEAGWCAFTIEGYTERDGVISVGLSVTDRLEVKPGLRGAPAEPTASQALQLQHEIDSILPKIDEDVEKARLAAGNAEAARDASSASAALSQSWAVGGTGTRTGEDTDNAKYYAAQAKDAAVMAGADPQTGSVSITLDRISGMPSLSSGAGGQVLALADDKSGLVWSAGGGGGGELSAHLADKANPHVVTKAQIGLGSVDNTADTDKPVSTAMQSALDQKAAASHSHSASAISEGTFSGAVKASSASAGAALTTGMVRNIVITTANLIPGTSSLESGLVYLVYEVS